jgi:hypothetical protein
MGTHVRLRTRRMLAVAAMATMMLALLPAAPASAGSANLSWQSTETLNSGTLACGSASFFGTAFGTHGNAPVVGAAIYGTFVYCNDIHTGTADGEFTVLGGGMPTHRCNFARVRIGSTVVYTLSGHITGTPCRGSGTAQWAPKSAPGAAPGTAEVMGVMVISH